MDVLFGVVGVFAEYFVDVGEIWEEGFVGGEVAVGEMCLGEVDFIGGEIVLGEFAADGILLGGGMGFEIFEGEVA